MKRTEIVVLIVVIAVAAGFRLFGLSWAPPGLHPDEAVNGTIARSVLDSGEYKTFYRQNGGHEGLFINLQAVSLSVLGNTPPALRVVSAIAGILTVLGTYLLTRRMFDDWRLAAIAAFLMAIGFWHVNFSRIGISAIMAPLCAVWGFYFLYKGIEMHRLWHWGLAGIFFGLGYHTYFPFRIMPLVVAITLMAYWLSLHAVFSHGKYHDARHQMFGGAALMIALMILVLLPMAAYFYANTMEVTGIRHVAKSAAVTLGMFFFEGDPDWLHNIAGQPVLFWPVAALFAVGLLRTIWRFFHSWSRRGHPGVVYTLLLSWFIVGLIPAVLFNDGSPNAMLALLVAPAVYIMAALGLHWVYISLERWYGHSDRSLVCKPGSLGHRVCIERGSLIVGVTLIVFLFALSIVEAHRYFIQWAEDPRVASVFSSHELAVADRLLSLPPSTLKYVVISRGNATALMYLTDTWLSQQQQEQNIYYITQQQFDTKQYPRGAFVIQLGP